MSDGFTFANYPEFVEADNRKNRPTNGDKLTAEKLNIKSKAFLPPNICEGNTILDLGCAAAQFGHWALYNGAKHYTGVELQEGFLNPGKEALSKYWSTDKFDLYLDDINHFLDEAIKHNNTFDVVLIASVLVLFLDNFNILSKIAKVANKNIIIECNYPTKMFSLGDSVIEIGIQTASLTQQNGWARGYGTKISPNALRIIMGSYGWRDSQGIIYPKNLQSEDKYLYTESAIKYVKRDRLGSKSLPNKFILNFEKAEQKNFTECTSSINSQNDFISWNSSLGEFTETDYKKWTRDKWSFDNDTIALTFQSEAENHIPSYDKVIQLCIDEARKYDIGSSIIDFGSALGYTVSKFCDNGFDCFGIESSQHMIDNSLHKSRIFHDNNINAKNFIDHDISMVLCNWTLHFCNEELRKTYYKTSIISFR